MLHRSRQPAERSSERFSLDQVAGGGGSSSSHRYGCAEHAGLPRRWEEQSSERFRATSRIRTFDAAAQASNSKVLGHSEMRAEHPNMLAEGSSEQFITSIRLC